MVFKSYIVSTASSITRVLPSEFCVFLFQFHLWLLIFTLLFSFMKEGGTWRASVSSLPQAVLSGYITATFIPASGACSHEHLHVQRSGFRRRLGIRRGHRTSVIFFRVLILRLCLRFILIALWNQRFTLVFPSMKEGDTWRASVSPSHGGQRKSRRRPDSVDGVAHGKPRNDLFTH